MAPVGPPPAAETAERPARRRPGAARPAASSEQQPSLDLGAVHRAASELAESPAAELVPGQDFQLPPLKFLSMPRTRRSISVDRAALAEMATGLEKVLDDFGVRGEIVDVKPGPVVTMFELEPAPGTRAARVIALADDIARSLCAMSVRVAVVPGRNVIGIELPNDQRETVLSARSVVERGLRGHLVAPNPGARQGHWRRVDRGRSGAHAAFADRRHHGLGQIGRDQRDDSLAALSPAAERLQIDHDRSQGDRALGL